MAGAKHGGAEAFFCRLVPSLARAGLEQETAIRPYKERLKTLEYANIPTHRLAFGGWLDFQTRGRLKRCIEIFSPDILFAWMSRAARFCPTGNHTIVGRLGGYYDLKYYHKCNHLIGNTKNICDYIISAGWPAENCHYLPNFVNATLGTPIDRSIFNTPNDVPLLLAMGRLHENKAFDVLLDAVASVPGCYLWVAGDGPLHQSLLEQSKQLGVESRIRLLGWRQDTTNLLATCDIFLCPSRHEPLGNVVIEAWAQHKPVIAAAAQGPTSLITPSLNGLLFPIDDARAASDAILQVMASEDLRTTLAENGFNTYQEYFTEARVVALYQDFFEMVKN